MAYILLYGFISIFLKVLLGLFLKVLIARNYILHA